MLSILKNATYRLLFGAQIVALIGTGMLTVAVGLLAYSLAPGAGAAMATVITVKIVADVVFSPLMSALTERLPRTGVLVGADVVRALTALALPLISVPRQA